MFGAMMRQIETWFAAPGSASQGFYDIPILEGVPLNVARLEDEGEMMMDSELWSTLPILGEDHLQLVHRARELFPKTELCPDPTQNRYRWLMAIHKLRTETETGWKMDNAVTKEQYAAQQEIINPEKGIAVPVKVPTSLH